MKKITAIIIVLTLRPASGQVFHDPEIQIIVKKAVYHIYNITEDSAMHYIKEVDKKLPHHPVAPLMKAMKILWFNIPIISEELFAKMKVHLYLAIERAKAIDPDLKEPEMIFFSMASYGLLAEYYADQGENLKAIGEASRAYTLVKKGFEIVNEHPEFLLTTALYNYFREKYPEKHPVYKPLLWFFRSGNSELGLRQLQKACNPSNLSHVEAHVYLSYIYLRYEYNPIKAKKYLGKLINMYPKNFYAKAKYLESLANPKDFKDAPIEIIQALMQHKQSYYKLAGYVFSGYFEEVVNKRLEKAESAYRKGLYYGTKIPDHGEYFKSLGYLRLGKILLEKGETEEAEKALKASAKYAETEEIKKEAKLLLAKI